MRSIQNRKWKGCWNYWCPHWKQVRKFAPLKTGRTCPPKGSRIHLPSIHFHWGYFGGLAPCSNGFPWFTSLKPSSYIKRNFLSENMWTKNHDSFKGIYISFISGLIYMHVGLQIREKSRRSWDDWIACFSLVLFWISLTHRHRRSSCLWNSHPQKNWVRFLQFWSGFFLNGLRIPTNHSWIFNRIEVE